MSLTRYASMTVLSAKIAPAGGGPLMRTAHRHAFEYTPRPGYLYVRSRMISSRTNDNFDHFPAEEIKKAYRTFIGKPVFVNHANDNHRRARGVITAVALHEDVNPDGSEDVWVEGLMEVDAIRFPKLAAAILAGHIDRTSMGTDVQFSVCSVCNNKATSPVEYCQHIPRLKGQKVYRTTASGEKEGILVYEKCYGLGFFENSLLVEEPADPTAFAGLSLGGLDWQGKALGQPPPGVAVTNGLDNSRSYAVASADGREGQLAATGSSSPYGNQGEQRPDLSNVGLGKAARRVGRTSQAATSGNHVGRVHCVAAQDPVRQVLADAYVTGVPDDLPFRDGPHQGRVAPSVGTDARPSGIRQTESSVAAVEGATSPGPAGVRPTVGVDLGQVAVHLALHRDELSCVPADHGAFIHRKTAEVEPVEVAGLAIQAADTGRILMIQRSYSDQDDPARGTWEFPGGHLDDDEHPPTAAIREFTEEVGCAPPHGDLVGSWRSGPIYQGFVMLVPTESDVDIHCREEGRATNPDDPKGDDLEAVAWWLPKDAQSNPSLRAECKDGTDWSVFEPALKKATAMRTGYRIISRTNVPPHPFQGMAPSFQICDTCDMAKSHSVHSEALIEQWSHAQNEIKGTVDGDLFLNAAKQPLVPGHEVSWAEGPEGWMASCSCGRPFPLRGSGAEAWRDALSHGSRGNPEYDDHDVDERERLMHYRPPKKRTATWDEEDEDAHPQDLLDPRRPHDLNAWEQDLLNPQHTLCSGGNRTNSTRPGTCPDCGVRYSPTNLVVPLHARAATKTASTFHYDVALECGDHVRYIGSQPGQVTDGQAWACAEHGATTVAAVDGPGTTSNGLGMDTVSKHALRATAEEKVLAPADVDTMRDEQCPVCGEQDAYDGEKCQVCGFLTPPEEFGDPDTDKAKQTDLRQDKDDLNDQGGDLACDSCGATFTSGPAAKTAVVLDPEKGTDESDEAASTEAKAGDTCPTCGQGTLQPSAPAAEPVADEGFAPAGSAAQSAPAQDDADDPDGADGADGEDGQDGDEPSGLNDDDSDKEIDKDSEEDGDKPDFLKKKDKKKPTAARREVRSQKEQSMRPALAALAAQQKQITALQETLAFVVQAAGLESHPRVASLMKSAADENPAFGGGWENGAPVEGAPEAPSESTQEAATPTAKDDVESVGSTPLTDVTPQATTSLDSNEVTLDVTEPESVDVTAPIAGTDTLGKGERGGAGTNRVETEVRAGTPSDNSAAFRDGGFLGAKDEARTIASLRLARLQIQAGIASGDDLDLGTVIAASDRSDESIQAEIGTLNQVVTAAQQPQRVARNLVPQGARQATRTVPSMTADTGLAVEASVGSVSDEEMAFE